MRRTAMETFGESKRKRGEEEKRRRGGKQQNFKEEKKTQIQGMTTQNIWEKKYSGNEYPRERVAARIREAKI